MPPKSEKEEMLNALSKRVFSAMLDDIIFDVALQAHHEVLKGKAVCPICHTSCGSVHVPGSSSQTSGGEATSAGTAAGPSSRANTPSSIVSETGKASGGSANGGNGISTPTGNKDGTILLDCLVCPRQIASNRYAPHLASCMGLTSARRGPARGTAGAGGKPKLPSDAGRSASPASETGNGSDERLNGKSKGKAKSNRPEDNEGSLKRKRLQSPQTSPAKTNKKMKASGSPVSRVKAVTNSTGPPTPHYGPSAGGSKSKVPSKLRESSTTSFLERSPSSSSSRSSSPAGTPASSVFSAATQSPSISARVVGSNHGPGQSSGVSGGAAGRGKPKAAGTGPPARRVMSPPRPPPPTIVPHMSIVSDYGMHDGDETGSSTDTDSD